MNEKKVQTESFALDPAMLGHLMGRQAPDLAKALLELVMNSVDGAATHIDVTIKPNKVTVVDDGQGLPHDPVELRRVFGTFGAPHEDGDAVLGEFRLGRGQALAAGRTIYRSGPTQITTDFKKSTQGWELKQGLPHVAGCSVEVFLYQPTGPDTETRLAKLVAYLPGTIAINGTVANVPATTRTWDIETTEAYIELKGDSLLIYNLGAYVTEHVAERWGVGGTIVSKQRLRLTVGRNEVMADCPVFRRIVATVEASFTRLLDKRRQGVLPTALRRRALQLVETRKMKATELDRFYVIRDARGKWISLRTMFAHKTISIGPAGHPAAHHAITEMGILVVQDRTLEEDGVDLGRLLRTLAHEFGEPPRLIDWRSVVALAKLGRRLLNNDELGKDAATAVFGLQFASRAIAQLIEVYNLSEETVQIRQVVGATQDSESDFTDGETYIALTRDLLEAVAKGKASPGPAIAMIARSYLLEPTPTDGSPRSPEDTVIRHAEATTAFALLHSERIENGFHVARGSLTGGPPLTSRILIRDMGDIADGVISEMRRIAPVLRNPASWLRDEAESIGASSYASATSAAELDAQMEHVLGATTKLLATYGLSHWSVSNDKTHFQIHRNKPPKPKDWPIAAAIAFQAEAPWMCASNNAKQGKAVRFHKPPGRTERRAVGHKLVDGMKVITRLISDAIEWEGMEAGYAEVIVIWPANMGNKTGYNWSQRGYSGGDITELRVTVDLSVEGKVSLLSSPGPRNMWSDELGGRIAPTRHTIDTKSLKTVGWNQVFVSARRSTRRGAGKNYTLARLQRKSARAKPAIADKPIKMETYHDFDWKTGKMEYITRIVYENERSIGFASWWEKVKEHSGRLDETKIDDGQTDQLIRRRLYNAGLTTKEAAALLLCGHPRAKSGRY
jgi:hypothetical protein